MATTTNDLSSLNSHVVSKSKAIQLINQFKNIPSPPTSSHYPKITRLHVADELGKTVNNPEEINHAHSSQCGPAVFFLLLAKTRPDLYVKLVIDLFNTGQATIGATKLNSPSGARYYQPRSIRHSDWILLSSIKRNYNQSNEQHDRIAFPEKFKQWFRGAGYSKLSDSKNISFKHRYTKAITNLH